MCKNMANSIFDQFTRKYALSKTLRFELKPVGKTLENMRRHLRYDKNLQTFLADQEIEDAYQILKPVLDAVHEEFINRSLESDAVKKINFSEYFKNYQEKDVLKESNLENIEKHLRKFFSKAYDDTAETLKNDAGKNGKGKNIFKERSYKILTEKGILDYIGKSAEKFSDIKPGAEIDKALSVFKKFFTYFGGFNQNRENYYQTENEATTAVATRIVHENLPRFCDNILFFKKFQEEYKNAYSVLQKTDRNLVNKDGEALVPIEDSIFKIENFVLYLSQRQIEKYNKQIGNANFLVNLYNQAKREEKGFIKLPFFKVLYKQIGCGKRDSLFFALTHDKMNEAERERKEGNAAFSVEEVLKLAADAGKKYFEGISDDGIINTIPELLNYLKNRENYLGVYWSKVAINTISNKYFANWHELKDKLKAEKIFSKPSKGSEEDVKIPLAVELEGLFNVLNQTENWREVAFKTSILSDKEKNRAIKESQNPTQALLGMLFADVEKHAKAFLNESAEIVNLQEYKSSKSKERIKSWMDHALAISRIIKYFSVKESKIKGSPLDSAVSLALDTFFRSNDANWFKWYDALRNYLTKKPQDEAKKNKLKLNFENSTLAAGWDVNKEPNNYCVLLQNPERRHFLAIIAKNEDVKGYNKIFVRNSENQLYKLIEKINWKKIEYKLLPVPNRMLPKCLLRESDRFKYGATQEILDIYENGEFKKNESSFSKESLHKIIDFFKTAIKKYEDWNFFEFSFKKTIEYQDISQFYSDVEMQGYKLETIDINKSVLDKWVDEGLVYLFEIKNQDYNQNKKSDHLNNLHTIYWQMLFEDIPNRPKLNGEAELFYRKPVTSDKLEKIMDNSGRERIKNFRFSKEKFLFHVPITLNFCLKDKRINDLVNENLATNENIYFLGIDRGEKHLAYYSLIDNNGIIKEQGTLNVPLLNKDGEPRTIKVKKMDGKVIECGDYNEILEARAGDRDFARKNWQTIGTIKELKEGYISQVVRKIADLAVKHNAFIVLEDLNTEFKRGRQKIEKSVYQKLELALAKKLNFLVDKKARIGEIGSVTNALQLTPPVTNFGDIEKKKQVGIMLYTRANYTSQTDPITGWRKTFDLKKGSEDNIKEQVIEEFSEIGFDGKDYFFVYSDKNTGKQWKLYSGKNGKSLDRFRGKRGSDKNEWSIEPYDIVEILDGVFADFDKSRSLYSQIVEEEGNLKKIRSEHTAWESLRFAVDLIQQIRNTGMDSKDADFILSPVRDKNNKHFDSREATLKEPNSGDANGAYNIARKGIIMNEHIKLGYRLFISDAEWDAWLAGKNVWENWIEANREATAVLKKSRF